MDRIRMRRLRRGTISSVLLLRPFTRQDGMLFIGVPFLLYILFVILDPFGVYILVLLFLRRLNVNIKCCCSESTCYDWGSNGSMS